MENKGSSLQQKWRQFTSKFRKPVSLTGRNYRTARRLLLNTIDILNTDDIEYRLDAGTLLGLARDGDLIPWDSDVDITLPIAEVERLRRVFWKFWIRGWRITDHYQMHSNEEPWKRGALRSIKVRNRNWLLFGRGRIAMDIFITYPHGEHYWWSMANRVQRAPRKHYDQCDTIEYAGRAAKVPHDHEGLLRLFYGDWRTPKRDFNPGTEDGSILHIIDSYK